MYEWARKCPKTAPNRTARRTIRRTRPCEWGEFLDGEGGVALSFKIWSEFLDGEGGGTHLSKFLGEFLDGEGERVLSSKIWGDFLDGMRGGVDFLVKFAVVMELESGFIVDPELDGDIAGPELLHRSERGVAEIWRVQKFGQFVVLKALKPEYREDPVYEALLKKEFEIGYSLNHPAVCRTWHYRRHPQLGNCIEMEWVDGVTLSERFAAGNSAGRGRSLGRFREGRLDDALFRKIATELCDAVGYLHSRQVIHRDIKPSNILITHNGDNVKLIDFGLADSDDSAILKMPAGTEAWLAPEVRAGEKADVRTDIWAVGRVLSELLRGGSLLSRRYARVLSKACADRPEDRYQHIAEFKQALLRARSRAWMYIVPVLVMVGIAIGGAIWVRQGDKIPSASSMPRNDSLGAPRNDSLGAPRNDSLEGIRDDCTAVIPGTSITKENTSAAKRPRNDKEASQEDVEALFQQATELFK